MVHLLRSGIHKDGQDFHVADFTEYFTPVLPSNIRGLPKQHLFGEKLTHDIDHKKNLQHGFLECDCCKNDFGSVLELSLYQRLCYLADQGEVAYNCATHR